MGPFTGKPLSSVTLEDIARIVGDKVPEGLHLEYKRELLLDQPDKKKELLRDLSAFANAEGGLIVFGVDEERDAQGQPTSLPKTAHGFTHPNAPTLIQIIEQLIKDGIDERLPGYEMHFLSLPSGKIILLVRIPASLRAPHMVTLGGDRRFYMRTNSGKADMSTAQVRDVALRMESLVERVQSFIRQRIEKCLATTKGPFAILHVLPLLRRPGILDVTNEAVIQRIRELPLLGNSGVTHCLEGLKCHSDTNTDGREHTIFFRDGAAEFLDQYHFGNENGMKYLACRQFEQMLFKQFENALALYREGRIQPPILVALSLVRCSDCTIAYQHFSRMMNVRCTENEVFTDPLVLTEIPNDIPHAMRPLLDFVWNAFGHARCMGYDSTGKYIGYR